MNDSTYSVKLKLIRPFTIGFLSSDGFDLRDLDQWSSAKKASVNRYYNLIQRLTTRAYYVYRPRSKKRLHAIRRSMGVEDYRKLKVGIIQVPTRYDERGKRVRIKPKLTFRKDGTVSIKIRNVTRETILFEEYGITPEILAQDPELVGWGIQQETDYEQYTIMAGEFEVGKGVPKFLRNGDLVAEIAKLVESYGADKFDPNDKNSHFFGNWLFGLIGYNFEHNEDLFNYIDSLEKYKKEREVINKKIKSYKQYIEKLEEHIKLINKRSLLQGPLSRLISTALTEASKETNSKTRLNNIKKMKEYNKKNRGKPIHSDVRKFILDYKADQIERMEEKINQLIFKRLNITNKK